MNIPDATKYIFDIANIKCKDDLDKWCGGPNTRKRLYDNVKIIASGHWNNSFESEYNAKASVRINYEKLLPGYEVYRKLNSNS